MLRLAVDGDARDARLPAAPATLHSSRTPPDHHAMGDCRGCGWCLDRLKAPETRALKPRTGEPGDRALAPDPRSPLQPSDRLQLRHMASHHPLVKSEPDLHRSQRYHPDPPNETPHSQRPRPRQSHVLTQQCLPTPAPGRAAVRPAPTVPVTPVSTGSRLLVRPPCGGRVVCCHRERRGCDRSLLWRGGRRSPVVRRPDRLGVQTADR